MIWGTGGGQSRGTMEFCVAEFLSVSASFGVSEETDAGMTFSVKVVAGLSAWSYTFLRDLFSSACCARFSSKRERPFFTSCFLVDLSAAAASQVLVLMPRPLTSSSVWPGVIAASLGAG